MMDTIEMTPENVFDQFHERPEVSDIFFKGSGPMAVKAKKRTLNSFPNPRRNESGRISIIVSETSLRTFLSDCLSEMSDTNLTPETLEKSGLGIDFSYFHKGSGFRVNACRSSGKWLLTCRRIPPKPIPLDQLRIDTEFLKPVLSAKEGLFLVAGPTGSGKSTTLAGIIDYFTRTRESNIITLEDPIEYIFEPNKCNVSQREFRKDFLSFEKASEDLMRQSPDIILIGEGRSRETVDAMLALAETGHLVFSTVHAKSADASIGRLARLYGGEENYIYGMLADNLIGTLHQRLIIGSDGNYLPCIETMYVTPTIRGSILSGDFSRMRNPMQSGRNDCMITAKQYLQQYIYDKGLVDHETFKKLADGME